jgi:hypothetical protein
MFVLGILILPTILLAQKGLSHVRVVRLSYVSGTVAVKRPASTEWAKALVNTPLQEGFEVSTSANSYAEVEFENGSTARLGEFSRVNFDQLAMDENGNKLNRLTFEQGYATFHFLPEHHDAYSVKIAETTLTPNGKSEFRTDLGQSKVRVEVFSGSVQIAAPSQTVKLGKDKILEFNPEAMELALNETQGIVKDSWDKWTSGRDVQEQLSLTDQAVGPRGSLYGWGDLDAYGEWGFFPGFGYGWSPFASAGWSPYSMGMWSWYPGMGYTWISGEPWGWMPYHFGNWNFSPGFGWFWMMGNADAAWSPALVSWYSGPGWIGWAPLGAFGAMGLPLVTTVPGGTIQNGLMISPQNVSHLPLTAGTRIRSMPFQPGAGAMLSGAPLSGGGDEVFTPHAGTTHMMAPTSILMGGDAAKEQALQEGHSAHQPLRVRLGTTLGGHYAVGGAVGEFRGDAFAGTNDGRGAKGMKGPQEPEFSRGGPSSGPALLPHGHQAETSSHDGGAPMAPPSGGGPSGNVSSPAPSVNTAGGGHSSSSSSSGGHH